MPARKPRKRLTAEQKRHMAEITKRIHKLSDERKTRMELEMAALVHKPMRRIQSR